MGPYFKVEPIQWRVLSNADGKALLLSDKILDMEMYHTQKIEVTWKTCTIRSWLNGYNGQSNERSLDYSNDNFIDDAFNTAEKDVIVNTTVVSNNNSDNTTDRVFFLSPDEVKNTAYCFVDDNTKIASMTDYAYGGGHINAIKFTFNNDWWLRRTRSSNSVDYVSYNGDITSNIVNLQHGRGVRPAINLDSTKVLFTSPAENGKSADSGLQTASTYTGSAYKLTLKDSAHSAFNAELKSFTNKSAFTKNTAVVSYSGAKTGNNEYISAMIKNNDTVKYYGKITSASSASGEITLTLPDDFDTSSGDVLCVFNEQRNGDFKPDYSSDLKAISIVSSETALEAVLDSGCTNIQLMNDIKLTKTLDLSDKNIELDLNGYVLEGNIELADTSAAPTSVLTLTDSRPTGYHSGSSLPSGGVINGAITLTNNGGSTSILNANGGTVSRLNVYSYVAKVYCTNNKPTAFLDAHVVVTGASIHGGIYYSGEKLKDRTDDFKACIKEPLMTFISDNAEYAYEVVASDNTAATLLWPDKKEAIFNGWYNGDTKYTFGSAVSENITLTANWTLIISVATESELRQALTDGYTFFKLTDTINLTQDLDFSNKNITLDLHGQVLNNQTIRINTGYGKATLTLMDSQPLATHADASLPLGGIINCNLSVKQEEIAGNGNPSWHDCNIYANGGSIIKEFYSNTQAAMVSVSPTSNTPTAFYGPVNGYPQLFGGLYYGGIKSPNIKEKKITFSVDGKDYAYEILADGNSFVLPTAPTKSGARFDGWYNNGTKYNMYATITESMTLTANFWLRGFSIVGVSAENGKATATVGIPAPGEYAIVFVDYDGDKLKAVDIVTPTITAVNFVTISSNIDMTLNKGDKVMLWENLETMFPLCSAYIVE